MEKDEPIQMLTFNFFSYAGPVESDDSLILLRRKMEHLTMIQNLVTLKAS